MKENLFLEIDKWTNIIFYSFLVLICLNYYFNDFNLSIFVFLSKEKRFVRKILYFFLIFFH